MKKFLAGIILSLTALAPSFAFAGSFYDNRFHSSSNTVRTGFRGANRDDAVITSSGPLVVQSTYTGAGAYPPLLVEDAAGTQLLVLTSTGHLSVAYNGTNCSVGEYSQGVDNAGNAEGCTTAGVGDMVLAATQTVTGGRRYESYSNFVGSATFASDVTFSSHVVFGVKLASQTFLASQSFSGTSFSSCNVAGSSVTVTLPAAYDLRFSFGGSVENDTTDSEMAFAILLDGEFLTGYGATLPVMRDTQGNGGQPNNSYFTRLEENVAAGTHTACLGIWGSSGVVTIQDDADDARGWFRMEISR